MVPGDAKWRHGTAWQHQATTWTNSYLLSMGSCGIHRGQVQDTDVLMMREK